MGYYPMLLKRLRLTLEMIKFEHSVFALPFALTGALLAFRDGGFASAELWRKLLWIVVAMVGARSAAMAFNRLVDADIDGRNPRTRMRHLPAGLLSRGFAWAFVAVSSAVFVLAAGELNPLCLRLAPLALAIVFFYSFTKRFTSFSHLVLGFSLGIAPAAAWIAVRGDRSIRAFCGSPPRSSSGPPDSMSFIPARITSSIARRGWQASRACSASPERSVRAQAMHVLMVVCLLALVYGLHLGALALAGIGAIVALLVLRAQPGQTKRLIACECGLLHHERLRQRAILFILGR